MTTDPELERAVRILRAGGLVAFPTETVYGLGGDAENPAAVQRIFQVKGRPTSHPLIVHVGDPLALSAFAREVPGSAARLSRAFWPGPLTLVVRKGPRVSPLVTGGRDTVAVRVPQHPVALALLRTFGGAVAAPSANRFGCVSPTTAAHVQADLGSDVDCVLDGGAANVGVESTIVDVSGEHARVLRLGGVSIEAIERTLDGPVTVELDGSDAPGQLPSHYAPRARVTIVNAAELLTNAEHLRTRGERVAALVPAGVPSAGLDVEVVPSEPEGYARALYAALRRLDQRNADVILVVPPDERGIGRAVVDRLRRAAAPRNQS
ncbi:MAG TPA: L-threonylcarbamoyladenylate synthase [Polyangiaceae bacterium]